VVVTATAGQRFLVALGTVLSTLMYAIDMTIVNVALPHMQGTLQATQDQISWVVTSYIVASAVSTPLSGWLGTRFGLRPVLSIAVAGFTVASVLCGIANGLTEVVLARILQGIFGAAVVPLAQVALLHEYPTHKHGRVMALWSLGVMVGPVIGPTLGGWLTDQLSWRWAFFINVPVGIASCFVLLRGLSREHDASAARPFDWTGFVLLSLALAMVQLMLDRGHSQDWFSSSEILGEAFLGGLFGYMFIVHMLTAPHPFIDPGLFRDVNFTVAVILMFAIGLTMLTPTVLMPTFMQTIQGYSATQAGILQASRGLGAVVAVLIAGRLTGRVSPRFIVGVGLGSAIVSLLLLGHISVDSPSSFIWLTGMVNGIGPPTIFVPLSVAAYSTLRREQRAEAGAMLTLLRTIGSSIGISIAVALIAHSTQVNQSYLTEWFTPFATDRWQALGFLPGPDTRTAHLVAEITRQAAAIAYANVFYLLAFATLGVAPLVWLVRRR
jgi:DHA2 family multidrug resistance protein